VHHGGEEMWLGWLLFGNSSPFLCFFHLSKEMSFKTFPFFSIQKDTEFGFEEIDFLGLFFVWMGEFDGDCGVGEN